MKIRLTTEQLANVTWVEWSAKKHGTTKEPAAPTAHAVDPTSLARTKVLRTVTGAVVPADAVPAKPGTPRDAFSERVLALAAEDLRTREAAAAARAAKQKPPADGVRVRGDLAEVWKGGQLLGSFPAERLVELPTLLAPKAEKGKRGKATA